MTVRVPMRFTKPWRSHRPGDLATLGISLAQKLAQMQVAEEAGEVVAKLTGEIPQSDPAPMPSLLEIDGIGPATVRDLAGNGIHTLVDLLAWDPEPLADTLNRNTPAQVTAWQVEARQMLEEMAALRAE